MIPRFYAERDISPEILMPRFTTVVFATYPPAGGSDTGVDIEMAYYTEMNTIRMRNTYLVQRR